MRNVNLTLILEELKKREPIFHHPEFGTSRLDFKNMTDPDFREVGASGQRYNRDDVIDTCFSRYQDADYVKNDFWETKNFECREISPNCYLLTYHLIQGKEKRLTHRATIWQLIDGEWKIFYHQGTIIEKTTQ
jgi:hypothetical protein